MRPIILSVAENTSLAYTRNCILTAAGFAIAPANDAHKAIQLLNSLHIDVVLLGHTVRRQDQNRIVTVARGRQVPVVLICTPDQDILFQDRAVGSLDGVEHMLEAILSLVPAHTLPHQQKESFAR